MTHFIKFIDEHNADESSYIALIIFSRYIGDCILQLSVLRWLIDQKPYAQITIICEQNSRDLFEAIPNVKDIIILEPHKSKLYYYEVAKRFKKCYWDLIIDLKNCIISRMLPHNQLIIRQGKFYRSEHMLIHASRLIAQQLIFPKIWISEENKKNCDKIIQGKSHIIAICPMSSKKQKIWPIANFIKLVKCLTQHASCRNTTIMVIAGPKEHDKVQPLLDAIPNESKINLVGSALQLAAACLSHVNFCIANDTSLMHLSYVMGAPTLALFGEEGSQFKRFFPIGYKSSFIVAPYKTKDMKTSHMMNSLTVEMVIKKLEQMELI